MTRDELDWSVIKFHTIIFIAVFIVSLAIIYGSGSFKDDMFGKYKDNKTMFSYISQKYLSIDEDEKIIREYYPEFIALYRKGIIGREHRLNWIETLRASSERVKLPGLTYDISPQEEYSPGFSTNLGKFALYSSTMKLTISMLHEGDLSRLIKDMTEHAEGMFTITKCNFTRQGKVLIKSRDAKNITASCELQWINIRMADGSEIKLS